MAKRCAAKLRREVVERLLSGERVPEMMSDESPT
jgi:hypothetical protein